jgi:hypothetical protein
MIVEDPKTGAKTNVHIALDELISPELTRYERDRTRATIYIVLKEESLNPTNVAQLPIISSQHYMDNRAMKNTLLTQTFHFYSNEGCL